ncbi:MAG: NAD(P)H-dependent oxidoreductase [Nannocystales bacterium]
MRHLIIYAHPSADSFNHALLERSRAVLSSSGSCDVIDLYAQGFDPLLDADEHHSADAPKDVLAHQRRIEKADHLVFIYPIWWYDRPAILKGWCDRVLRYGFAYEFDAESGTPIGRLRGKSASVVVTTGLIKEGDPDLDWAVRSMTQGTLEFCGISKTRLLPLFGVPRVSAQVRTQLLSTVANFLRSNASRPTKQQPMTEPTDIRAYYASTMAKAPAAVMQWYLTLNLRDSEGLRATMTSDFTFHSPLGDFDSPQGYVDMVGKFGGWVETKRLVIEGDTVVHEFVYHMTDPGSADIPTLEIFDMRGELICASNVYNNPADFPSD